MVDNKKFLHIGCGPKRKDRTTNVFNKDEWEEVTLDIDPSCKPDIIGSMTDLSMIEDNSYDALYSSHNIEHLFMHEAVEASKEFYRIIKDDGYIMVVCPDIISTCEAIVEKGPLEPLYYLRNNNNEIDKRLFVSGIDILYGWRQAIQAGNHYMAHKTAFSEESLTNIFFQAGFNKVASKSRKNFYDINLIAFKESSLDEQSMENLLKAHLQ